MSMNTATTATAAPATKTVNVSHEDANGLLSNRAFNAAGDAGYWWLRDVTAGCFVDLKVNGYRLRGDRKFSVDIELVRGHEYMLGAGRGSDAVRGEFHVNAE